VATVRTVPSPIAQVELDGALWRARMWELQGEGVPVAEGSAVVVESIDVSPLLSDRLRNGRCTE
jgi:hypothetical protein